MGELNNLPADLLLLIGAFLDQYRDYVHLRSSSSWLRNTLPKWPNHLSYPCLMLPDDDDKPLRRRGFYNILNKEVTYYELPESTRQRQRHCVGSSNGWLVSLEEGKLSLLNPIDSSQIPLPHFSTFPDIQDYDPKRVGKEYGYMHGIHLCYLSQDEVFTRYIVKVVLCFSNPDEFIAVAIYGEYGHLAFTKFGHHKWTHIDMPISYFQDCIFSDGKIYALNVVGDVVVSTIHNPSQILTAHVNKLIPSINLSADCIYLVKTDDDELLMVEKMTLTLHPREDEVEYSDDDEDDEEEDLRERPPPRRPRNYATYGFKLFRLDSNQNSWLPINNLDDYAIFLGFNTSICISSRCLPNLKGNRIYYTNDQIGGHTQGYIAGHGFVVFNISDGSFQRILYEERPLRLLFWPQSIWVMLKCC